MGRSERAKSVKKNALQVEWEKFLLLAAEDAREQQLETYRKAYEKEGLSKERIDNIIDGLSKSSQFSEDKTNEG